MERIKARLKNRLIQLCTALTLASFAMIFSGCAEISGDRVPEITIPRPELPLRPSIPDVQPPEPFLQTINDVINQPAQISWSSDSFRLNPGKHKIAVLLFTSPEAKDIKGRAASDILALNLKSKGIQLVERENIETLIYETQMASESRMELSREELAERIGRITAADYVIVGTIGAVLTERVETDLNYRFNDWEYYQYLEEVDLANEQIIEYNKELYDIINDKLAPLNQQIRDHNFAVMLNARRNNMFFQTTTTVDLDPEEKLLAELEGYRNMYYYSYSSSPPFLLDRSFPSLSNLLAHETPEYTPEPAPKNNAYMTLAERREYNRRAAEKRKKAEQTIPGFISKSTEEGDIELILNQADAARYGLDIEYSGPIVMSSVDVYNKLVMRYNKIIESKRPYSGDEWTLFEAFAVPRLIPLIEKQYAIDILSQSKYRQRRVPATQTTASFSLRVINTKTSEVQWIVQGSKVHTTLNGALDEMFSEVAEQAIPSSDSDEE